jgi:hypothetical protein
VVFGGEGEVEIRTHLLAKVRNPLSIRVENVQRASVNSPEPAVRTQYARVVVDELQREISVCAVPHSVRVLCSYNRFNLGLVTDGRFVEAAGELSALHGLRIERVDDLSLARP